MQTEIVYCRCSPYQQCQFLKIPSSLSKVIPDASCLRDLTNDQNFLHFSFVFLGQSGSLSSVSKEKILEIYFQYASLIGLCTCALNRLIL